ncbi:MAG TPA: VOC family protein [Verrucomicrobiae bacterium]|nr:VOC family protein [Verrucomicrobiae bacterium]
MQKISASLWFDKNAEEAMNFYVSVFEAAPRAKAGESEITTIKRYPGGYTEGPLANMEGKVLTGVFQLAGQQFMALDGGPLFKFNEAVSLVVECEDQAEIDYFWGKLSAVPESEQCGWLKDKFGVSWQIVPNNMDELMQIPGAMDALLKMQKLNIAELKAAGQPPKS